MCEFQGKRIYLIYIKTTYTSKLQLHQNDIYIKIASKLRSKLQLHQNDIYIKIASKLRSKLHLHQNYRLHRNYKSVDETIMLSLTYGTFA